MNASFNNCSLIRNILIQKDRQEENPIKAIKKNTHTTTKSDFINGIQNQKYIKTNKIKIEKAHF